MQGLGVVRLVLVASAVFALTACEGVKKQFGLTKQSPDEFRVVARAPLSLPPDFTLRPPEPGAVRPQEGTTAQQARQAIFRTSQSKSLTPALVSASTSDAQSRSAGELSLLKAAGADNVGLDIRALVNKESDSLRDDRGFLEALVFWRDREEPGTLVNAEGESRRLRENSALGKDVTDGETPSIERREKALFEGIF